MEDVVKQAKANFKKIIEDNFTQKYTHIYEAFQNAELNYEGFDENMCDDNKITAVWNWCDDKREIIVYVQDAIEYGLSFELSLDYDNLASRTFAKDLETCLGIIEQWKISQVITKKYELEYQTLNVENAKNVIRLMESNFNDGYAKRFRAKVKEIE